MSARLAATALSHFRRKTNPRCYFLTAFGTSLSTEKQCRVERIWPKRDGSTDADDFSYEAILFYYGLTKKVIVYVHNLSRVGRSTVVSREEFEAFLDVWAG